MDKKIVERLPRSLGQRLDKQKRYLAAVSGGADSLALADALLVAGIPFAVCHVEHGLRGTDSLEDAVFVERYCRERGIPYVCRPVKPAALAERDGLSLEDACRKLRYRALYEEAEAMGAEAILTAHHRDDQAETFLLRLLRGAGTDGLGAIREERGRLIRPLLEFSGEELRDYCRLRGLEWREDATNDDIRFQRNRVRHVLLPLLAREFNPNIGETLARTAEHLQADSLYLESVAEREYRRLLEEAAPQASGEAGAEGGQSGNRESGTRCASTVSSGRASTAPALSAAVRELPEAIRVRVLRKYWEEHGGGQQLTSIHLRDLQLLLERNSSGKKIILPEGWQGRYAYGKLNLLSPVFSRGGDGGAVAEKDAAASLSIPLAEIPVFPGGEPEASALKAVTLPGGETVRLGIFRTRPAFSYRSEGVYPLALLKERGEPLVFRRRQPGDRFYPLKGNGDKKLKKYLCDGKIPLAERDRMTVLASGSRVIWLPGLSNAGWRDDEKVEIQSGDWLYFSLM